MFSLLLVIFTFVQLNCENFFDIYDNPAKNDDEFTPKGSRKWDKGRYYTKLYNIGKEIVSCDERMPDMVALCEVEGDSVMSDLAHRTMLWPFHYEYIVTRSPDVRGINVGLLYNPDAFRPLASCPISVSLPDNRPTRDILYVKGLMVNLDTLHVFVLHSPSRRGGERKSRPNRMAVARRLVQSVDSVRRSFGLVANGDNGVGDRHHFLIAGDFNDYSGDPSLSLIEGDGLVEVSKDAEAMYGEECKGTYFFDGKWNSLDHIFASPRLSGWLMDCRINDHPSLLEPGGHGGSVPKRCFKGYKYNAGFSDHLPLVARFWIEV